MSASADDLDEDERATIVWWRRRNIRFIGVGVAAIVVALLWARSQSTAPGEDPARKTDGDRVIAETAPYEKPRTQPATTPPATESTPQNPPPPPVPDAKKAGPAPTSPFNDLAGKTKAAGGQSAVKHNRMYSYDAPSTTTPMPEPPKAPDRTGLSFKTSQIPGLKASPAIDDTYQLMPGLLLCVLDTAIQSDIPGPILCHLPGPVYSPKGVPLMEADTPVIGKYESLNKGSSRLMAASAYAHTPRGIWVPLGDAPMSDELGRTGLPGGINRYVLSRFGGAMILTLSENALNVAQALVSRGGNTYVNLNSGGSGGGTSGLAQSIFQDQANQPPTFTKEQGEMIAIFLPEPVDFSDSYRIEPKQ